MWPGLDGRKLTCLCVSSPPRSWCCLTPVSRLGCVLQKLLLVSLLQGAGGLPGSGTSQNASANVAVGASPPTTQASVSNGTNQTGNTHGAVMSRGAEKESQGSHSVRPMLAAAPTELPAASTSSPSNYPTEPVALGSAGHKVGTITMQPSSCLHPLQGPSRETLLPAGAPPASRVSVPGRRCPDLWLLWPCLHNNWL